MEEEEEREREREEKRRRASRSPGVQRPTTVVLWRLTSGNWCGHGGKKKLCVVLLVTLVKLKCHPQLANFIFIAGHRKEKGTDYETVSTLEVNSASTECLL